MASTRDANLRGEIYESPDDDGPRAVYADWLLEHDEPLGEYIQLQLARKKGSPSAARLAKKEQEILAAHGAARLWPDHPLVQCEDEAHYHPRWVTTDRGFPIAYNPPILSRHLSSRIAAATLARVAGSAGWSTVESFHVWHDDPEPVASLLLRSPMTSLAELAGVDRRILERIGEAPFPRVRALGIVDPMTEPLPPLGGFTGLRTLSLGAAGLPPGALERAVELTLVAPIEEIQLSGVYASGLVAPVLRAFATLPSRVTRLMIDVWSQASSGVTTRIDRGPVGPSVEVVITRREVEPLAEELRLLRADVPIRIQFLDFWNGGGFTKKNRTELQRVLASATKHLPRCTTLLDKGAKEGG